MGKQTESLVLHGTLARKRSAAWRYIRGGPSHLFMYLFGRFRIVRAVAVWAYRNRPSAGAVIPGASFVEEVDVDHAVRIIARDGVCAGLRLKADVLEALNNFSSTSTCFGEDNLEFPFFPGDKAAAERSYGRRLMVGRFDRALGDCAAVQNVASDPTLLAIARKYLGTDPVLLGARIWWSFAAGADTAQQMNLGQGFHYDIDGYRALAFFFYLTDVDSSTGPHVCVRGSHADKPLKSLLSLYKGHTDAEIAEWYGAERQVVISGSAGFGFAEDIFAFHKGLHPEDGDRLILQVRYGIRKYRKNGV